MKILFCILTALLENVTLPSNSYFLHDIVWCRNRLSKTKTRKLPPQCCFPIQQRYYFHQFIHYIYIYIYIFIAIWKLFCFMQNFVYFIFDVHLLILWQAIIVFNFVKIALNNNETMKYYTICLKKKTTEITLFSVGWYLNMFFFSFKKY